MNAQTSRRRQTAGGGAVRFSLGALFAFVTLFAGYLMLAQRAGLCVVVAVLLLALGGAALQHRMDQERLKRIRRQEARQTP